MSPFTEISILFKEMIIKEISYERSAYESVGEKSLSKVMSRKTTKKKKMVHNGLKKMKISKLH